jgi:Ca2+-binding RTX toxin-like protein
MAYIYGDENDNILDGLENEDDFIVARDGNDVLNGLGGEDFLFGEAGDDTLNGDSGNDYLYGDEGNDSLNGGDGNDYLNDGTGINAVDGGDGDDLFLVSSYATIDMTTIDMTTIDMTITYTDLNSGSIIGGDADGTTFKNVEHTMLYSGDGNDVINVSAAIGGSNIGGSNGRFYWANEVYTQGGTDTITTGMGRDFVRGGDGDDIINTGEGGDNVSGDDGNDVINTGAGNDVIIGSNGKDVVNAGDGDDIIAFPFDETVAATGAIDGGAGSDSLEVSYYYSDTPVKLSFTKGATGGLVAGGITFKNIERVILYGSQNNDMIDIRAIDSSTATLYNSLSGYEGDDKLTGSAFADQLFGNSGNDTLSGEAGADSLAGGSGGDSLNGGTGDDTLRGETENDKLAGGAGNDSLFGESESDTLTGVDTTASVVSPGKGELDYLVGGSGRDYFVLGDKTRVYYDDGNAAVDGTADFAYIADYLVSQKDTIRLQGTRSQYDLVPETLLPGEGDFAYFGVGIYRKGTSSNELIAIVADYDSTNALAQVEAGLQFLV